MHPYITPIANKFSLQENPNKAKGMKAYLLNQFSFFGIAAPERRLLCKEYYKQNVITDLTELEKIVLETFLLPQREFQYFGIELFAHHKKLWKSSSIGLIKKCLLTKSWWDSVDAIASEWLGPFFTLFPQKIMHHTFQWNRSTDIWLQRSSILFQKSYKTSTDTKLLSAYILHCSDSKEFFIQKAIGWALREYSKTNPKWVLSFVSKTKLPSLSKKEALKRM